MCIRLVALFAVISTTAIAADVTAVRLDGTSVSGQLESWDGPAIELRTGAGETRLAGSELLSLRWRPDPTPASEDASLEPAVELVDGTLLPLEKFRRADNTAAIRVRGLPPTKSSFRIPDRQVLAVRMQPLAGEVARQWQEIRDQKFAGDVLVVLKRGDQSIDYLEGAIADVDDEHVQFKIDDQVASVDRAKVAGLIFYRSKLPTDAQPVCVIHGDDGLRANIAKVALQDGELALTTVAGATFTLPLDELHSADFSAGKLVYLSDLEPASQNWAPLVALPGTVTTAANYGRPRRDRSAYGEPLSLWFPGAESSGAAGHTESYPKGLALRSRAEVVYRLPRGYSQFSAIAGIEPATRGDGATRLTIYGDDRPLVDAELAGSQAPLPIQLDINGVRRLRIVVDYGQNLDTGDWLNLCNARIVK